MFILSYAGCAKHDLGYFTNVSIRTSRRSYTLFSLLLEHQSFCFTVCYEAGCLWSLFERWNNATWRTALSTTKTYRMPKNILSLARGHNHDIIGFGQLFGLQASQYQPLLYSQLAGGLFLPPYQLSSQIGRMLEEFQSVRVPRNFDPCDKIVDIVLFSWNCDETLRSRPKLRRPALERHRCSMGGSDTTRTWVCRYIGGRKPQKSHFG